MTLVLKNRLLSSSAIGSSLLALILLALAAFPGVPAAAGMPPMSFVHPLTRPIFSSKFGMRKHPIFKVRRDHDGLDLAAPLGSPIRAIAAGTVVFADPYAGYGNLVVIRHANGMTSHYGHCRTIKVNPGQRVKPGQIIAGLGSTGSSTGPHLHLEIRLNGKPVDPLKIIPGLALEAEG